MFEISEDWVIYDGHSGCIPFILIMLPSSSGLGYQPLTLGTGVQIPLGAPKISWRIAQLIERTTDNREVVGLNPTVPTSLS